jgi:hypothetical protein
MSAKTNMTDQLTHNELSAPLTETTDIKIMNRADYDG